uniref:Uncharacterized protein n=1 Tax=Rhizophora mucronata TaxID=61149 RepID=A0A2P2P3L9_RHIMU
MLSSLPNCLVFDKRPLILSYHSSLFEGRWHKISHDCLSLFENWREYYFLLSVSCEEGTILRDLLLSNINLMDRTCGLLMSRNILCFFFF